MGGSRQVGYSRKIRKIKQSLVGMPRGGFGSGAGRPKGSPSLTRDQLSNSAVARLAGWRRLWFAALAAMVIGYALLGSLHPVYGDDLFFLLNDARWIVERHEIPSIDHFSYTAQGQP